MPSSIKDVVDTPPFGAEQSGFCSPNIIPPDFPNNNQIPPPPSISKAFYMCDALTSVTETKLSISFNHCLLARYVLRLTDPGSPAGESNALST